MSCSHPLIGEVLGVNPKTGKDIIVIHKNGELVEGKKVRIPCGHCTGCRIDKSRAWADRMLLEYQRTKKAIFATLTYRDSCLTFSEFEPIFVHEFMPVSATHRYADDFTVYQGKEPTIVKRDFQLFMKRLRSHFEDREIRFYASFEYGDLRKRPHVHAIIFGLDLKDFKDLVFRGKNELGDKYWSSDYFEGIWKLGFCCLCDVSWKTMAYTARYVQKKLTGEASSSYGDREPPTSLMSRNPGIGSYYLQEHPDLFKYSKIFVPDGEMQIPKYFLKKLNDENSPLYNPDLYDNIMLNRREFADSKSILELQNTDLYEDEYLKRKEFILDNSLKRLLRNKVH